MKELIYRRCEKYDYPEIQKLISDSFGLHNYVEDERTLTKVKKMYLYSCLSEQKFNRVAVSEGKIVGVIMGASKNDRLKLSNILNILKLIYYTILLWFENKNKISQYSEVYKAYNNLIYGMKNDFDGVLTLFAVREDLRGLGVGKEMLLQLNDYYLVHNTNRIYLYTDDICNYGFYEHMGFCRLKEKQITILKENKEIRLNVYLYARGRGCDGQKGEYND